MANAYMALSKEDQKLVYMLAVGRRSFKSYDRRFCKGAFGMCHDESGDPWWSTWESDQRDVSFFYRQSDGEWKFYCKYSMNYYSGEFQNTISEMLVLADEPLVFPPDDPVELSTQITQSEAPTLIPTFRASISPSILPTNRASVSPTESSAPSGGPTMLPTKHASISPTDSSEPSGGPSIEPSVHPSGFPSSIPSAFPSGMPSNEPSNFPSSMPSIEFSVLPPEDPIRKPVKISRDRLFDVKGTGGW
eukprot:CAMPEP_0195259394 /NCGR_PEP_ID=MMETSP0706-20130129/7933_1 /TAXON_ID=33640 /ORGANISM="Asterionellopsis glacialis, Strain CCMP134" /LENGTH=246 /DNA_ID=CAMNT_0040312875 /DNA_START=440 /DNA_END=1180 /DNA_ORIENTATION=+